MLHPYTLTSCTCHSASQNQAKSKTASPQAKFIFFRSSLGYFNLLQPLNRCKESWTQTDKTHTGQGLTMTEDNRPAYNSVLPHSALIPTTRGKLCKIEAECYYQIFIAGLQ